MARGDKIAADLADAKAKNAKQAKELRRKIANVTKNSTHTFSADFARLCNEATGAIAPDAADYGPLCAAGTHGGAGACAPPHPGLLAGGFDGVSEADLLAWLTVYGQRCQNIETQLRSLQKLEKDRKR